MKDSLFAMEKWIFKGTGKEENLKGKLLIISVSFLALGATNFTWYGNTIY